MFKKLFSGFGKKANQKRSETMPTSEPDDYDGYYDDVLPPDLDEIGEGLDKALVKKVIVVFLLFLMVVSFCVLLLYI